MTTWSFFHVTRFCFNVELCQWLAFTSVQSYKTTCPVLWLCFCSSDVWQTYNCRSIRSSKPLKFWPEDSISFFKTWCLLSCVFVSKQKPIFPCVANMECIVMFRSTMIAAICDKKLFEMCMLLCFYEIAEVSLLRPNESRQCIQPLT